jgi:hypothetical protein
VRVDRTTDPSGLGVWLIYHIEKPPLGCKLNWIK